METLFNTSGRLPRAPYIASFIMTLMVLLSVYAGVMIFTAGTTRLTVGLFVSIPILMAASTFSLRRAHDAGLGYSIVAWQSFALYGAFVLCTSYDPSRFFRYSFKAEDAALSIVAVFLSLTTGYLLAAPSDAGLNEFGSKPE